jgi:MFS family permease
MAAGLALQAIALGWIAAVASPELPFSHLVAPFIIAGAGMGLFFAPVANVVLSSVRPEEEGQASGANNALREMGGVFGVAVLAAIFAHTGSYPSPPDFSGQPFVDGMRPATWVGAAVVAVGAVLAVLIPRRVRRESGEAVETQPAFAGMGSCVPTNIEHVGVPEGGAVPATDV